MTVLQVSGLSVRYGAVRALHDVSLEVPRGASVALLGANGAGKTTMLRAVGGLLRYHGGSVAGGDIRFEGRCTARADASTLVAGGIGQALEGRRIFPELTVAENLRMGAFAAGRGPRSRDAVRDELLELFPILRERLGQRAGLLSGGQQQMLAIARAIMAQPRLLLLDEPSLGLAPIVVAEIADALRRINAGGTSILLADQNTTLALRATDHAYLLESGRLRGHGPTAELVLDDTLRASYLGTSRGHEQVAQEVTL
jgi:ABC-type branched-subunit amino acid transport system ATPase component